EDYGAFTITHTCIAGDESVFDENYFTVGYAGTICPGDPQACVLSTNTGVEYDGDITGTVKGEEDRVDTVERDAAGNLITRNTASAESQLSPPMEITDPVVENPTQEMETIIPEPEGGDGEPPNYLAIGGAVILMVGLVVVKVILWR
ncbi:MAG: hypothetical protein M0Q91_16425, partial [Methanoregula sp.]|nr:hypothetical protein [Methanoregula sp.]